MQHNKHKGHESLPNKFLTYLAITIQLQIKFIVFLLHTSLNIYNAI